MTAPLAPLPDGLVDPFNNSPRPVNPLPAGMVDPFNQQTPPAAPPASRSAPAEIAMGALRGVISGVPEAVGKTMQFLGAGPSGNAVRSFGENLGAQPWLAARPEGHGAVVNTLAQAAEGVGSFAPTIAAGFLNPVLGLTLGAEQMAGTAGQDTLEKAQAKGVSPQAADEAARLNSMQSFVTGLAGGAVGGKALGMLGGPIGRVLGMEGAPLAEGVLSDLTGTGGVMKPFLRQLPLSAAEGAGVMAAQAGAQAGIEQHYGIDNTDPLTAMKDSIGPALGLTAIMSPLALASRAMGVKMARDRTATLASGDTSPEIRMQLADQYATALSKVNPEAGLAFRQNAERAIVTGQGMTVDPTLMQPDTVGWPRNAIADQTAAAADVPRLTYNPSPAAPFVGTGDGQVATSQAQIDAYVAGLPEEQQAAARAKLMGYGAEPATPPNPLMNQPGVPLLENNPTPQQVNAQGQVIPRMFTLPDGTQTNDFSAANAHINSLPEADRPAGWARMMGIDIDPAANAADAAENAKAVGDLHGQIKDALTEAGVPLAQPMDKATFGTERNLKGQALAKAYKAYLADPATQEGLMREDASSYEKLAAERDNAPAPDLNQRPEQPAKPADDGTLGQQLQQAVRQQQVDAAYAAYDAHRNAEREANTNRMEGAREADAAQAQYDQHEAELEALHSQVNDALRANGIEPKPVTSEDPVQRDAVIRENAERYQQMLQDQAEQQQPVNEQVPASDAPPAQFNSQLSDQLAAALKQSEIDRAHQQLADTKAQQVDQLGNRASAERVADNPDANPPDANAPKQTGEITRDADGIKQASDGAAGATMRAFDKRVNNLGLDKLDSHQAQIDALQAAIDKGGMSADVQTMMQKLVDRWKADMPQAEAPQAPEPVAPAETPPAAAAPAPAEAPKAAKAQPELPSAPPQAATLGENNPRPGPETGNQPPAAEVVTEGMPSNLERTPKQMAGDLVARLQTVLADFHTRANNGEPIKDMTALEQARYKDAREYKDQLTKIWNGESTSPGADWWNTMSDFVGTAERPYTKPLESLHVSDPSEVDPGLLAPGIVSHKLSDVLAHLAENGSQPWVRTLAQRLNALGLDTGLFRGYSGGTTAGEYDMRTNSVHIMPGGETEQTIMHESVHAALAKVIDFASKIGMPKTQSEALLKRAWQDIEAVRTAALDAMGTKHDPFDPLRRAQEGDDRTYGLVNDQEFAAELMTNPEFQDFLRGQGTQKTLWQRAVDAVRRLLGMKVDDRTALEKAMDASNVLMDSAKNSRDFDASPTGAAEATDRTLQSFAKAADYFKGDLKTVDRGAFRNVLGWKTVDFIAHQMDVWPAMVKSGLADAVNQYRMARDSRRIVAEHLSDTLGKFSADVQRTLRATGDPRGWGEKMMRIGGASAIGQFDYRKNFADNIKAVDQGGGGRKLDADMKAHVDEVHRQFKQLEQAQPALAKALVDGEKQNRKMLIQQVSTLASNLISAHTGVVPRLEAELAKLPLDDANRAKLQERIQLAKLDATFAAKHLRGLDFMAKDLLTAKNGLPDYHLDGASSALGARLSAMFKEAGELPAATSLKAPLSQLERLYTPQVRNPYFSLGRSGDHYVNIRFKGEVNAQTAAKLNAALDGTNKVLGNLDGETHAFFRVDTLDQAVGLFQKLINAGGDAIDVRASSRGPLAATDMQSAAGISPALRQLVGALNTAVDTGTLNAGQQVEMKQALTRTLLSMLPETSARSAKMERRGVPGYDADFGANFARRASGAVQDLSNAYTNRSFAAAQTAMKEAAESMRMGGSDATPDEASRAQSVVDEINQRYADGMKPVDNQFVNLMNAFGHTFYLALSPAFLIRTMAQPYHRGLPILGARYGFVSAAKEIGGATGSAIKIISNTIQKGWQDEKLRGILNTGMKFDDIGLSKADAGFMQEMHDRGVFKLGQAQQLQHAITDAPQRQQDLARLTSMTAQYAEMTNRVAVGLAAFRMAMKDPKIADMDARTRAATDYAHNAINNAMDNFDADNTARQIGKHGIAGKVTPLLTSFMNYNLQTMQQIARTVQDGYFSKGALPGETAEAFADRKKYAQREFKGLMATTAMISGVMGLPFVNAFAGVYNTLHNLMDPDNPSDIRGDVRNWLSNNLGGAGDIIANGLPHAANIDSSTFGLENLLPGSEFLASRQKVQDKLESQSQQLLGPAVNAGVDFVLGASKLIDGNYMKGIEQMLPSGLKPYYKAAELGTVGYTDSKGNPLPMKAGTWDTMLQIAGFRTADKAIRDNAAHEFAENQELLANRREVLGNRFYRSAMSGDQAAQQDALGDISAFNQANPMQPMRDLGSIVRRHVMESAIGTATGLGINLTKRQMEVATRQLGYAAMPERD